MKYALPIALLVLCAAPVQAKPAYKKALDDYFGPLLPARMSTCNACHAEPGTKEPVFNAQIGKPHNAFGARVMAVAAELQKAGGRTDIPTRLDTIGREDSDGDGVSNVVELLTGHGPGKKADRPTEAETRSAPKLLAQLHERRSAYPWRPFETVAAPKVPVIGAGAGRPAAGIRNPIDAFVFAEQRKRGLKPRPEASPEVLLRRVYLDLVGIPPTPAETRAFLADRSPGAYERVVDRLLASPQYGQRWARHWMDIWRYSDWDGYAQEVRNSQPHIWRWRDWIVESLNADKGYDRMVQEMLAGDELAPDDPKVLPATGFLVRNWYKFSRHETLNKLVEGTSKAFLGVTLNCARCHDHKYDPFSQAEYFGFRAIFEPFDVRTDRVPGQMDPAKDGLVHAFDANPKAETFFLVSGDDRKPDKNRPMQPALPAALGGGALRTEPVRLPLTAYIPDAQEHVVRMQREAALRRVNEAEKALKPGDEGATLRHAAAMAALDALEFVLEVEARERSGQKGSPGWSEAAQRAVAAQRKQAAAEAQLARFEAEASVEKLAAAQPPKPDELNKAREALKQAEQKVSEAAAQLAAPLTTAYRPRYGAVFPETSTGRRLALARWITDRKNPLTARVAMNHIWLRHFGKPLVPTVFDFGGNGQPPTHPALLDWLASELMRQGWSMKAMHRLLVTSTVYRLDSGYDAANAVKDPDNRYLWRANSRRMEAEVVRDSLLAVSGQLDLSLGGPDLDPNLGLTSKRRSLYFRHSMEKQVELLATFDQANVAECYQRSETVVPQQALALANSSLTISASRVLAGKLWKEMESASEPGATRDFITRAFEQILGRRPSAEELRECEGFLQSQSGLLSDPKKLSAFDTGAPNPVPPAADPKQRAREGLVLVLLNHNDFVTIR